MAAIGAIAKKHNFLVIEDNAQGIDGHGDTFKQGEFSDAVCVSYIIQKNLGCFGDGGMVFSDLDKVNSEVRRLRNHGSTARNVHSFGFNSRLDDLQAGVLSAKMKHITATTDQRIAWSEAYNKGLAGVKNFGLPYTKPGYRHVFHLYVIEAANEAKRDELVNFLNENGVNAKTHYSIAIHKQNGFPWGKDCRIVGPLENAEKNAETCISLPMFPELTQEEVDYVIAKCIEWDNAQA